MHIVNRQQALTFLRQRGIPGEVIRALGDYSQGDPNANLPPVYSEDKTFYAGGGSQGGVQVVQPTLYQNLTSYSLYPFVIANASQQILPSNAKRQFLMVQNVSGNSKNLWVNFSSGAGVDNGFLLSDGQGIILDTNPPNNSIQCYFDDTTPQSGIIVEGAPTF